MCRLGVKASASTRRHRWLANQAPPCPAVWFSCPIHLKRYCFVAAAAFFHLFSVGRSVCPLVVCILNAASTLFCLPFIWVPLNHIVATILIPYCSILLVQSFQQTNILVLQSFLDVSVSHTFTAPLVSETLQNCVFLCSQQHRVSSKCTKFLVPSLPRPNLVTHLESPGVHSLSDLATVC